MSTRLIILGLLEQKPMHGYEIQQYVQEQQMEIWANILSGSIYFALNKMEEEGFLVTEAEERTGNRLRKKYAITDEGRRTLLELLREALAISPHSLKSDFSVAMSLAHLLTTEEREAILNRNLAELEKTRRDWEAGLVYKGRIHPVIEALLNNDLSIIDRDLELLSKLLALNRSETGGKGERPKATHLIVRTTGSYRGNPYIYEETVPIKKYEFSQWWLRFQSKSAAEVLRQIPEARDGESFRIDEPHSKTTTKIWAITLPEVR